MAWLTFSLIFMLPYHFLCDLPALDGFTTFFDLYHIPLFALRMHFTPSVLLMNMVRPIDARGLAATWVGSDFYAMNGPHRHLT